MLISQTRLLSKYPVKVQQWSDVYMYTLYIYIYTFCMYIHFILFFKYLFIYFWLCQVLVVASGICCCCLQALCCWVWASLQLWHVGPRVGRISSYSTWAQLSHGMWDLSSPSKDRTQIPYMEVGFSTTRPPGKSWQQSFVLYLLNIFITNDIYCNAFICCKLHHFFYLQ